MRIISLISGGTPHPSVVDSYFHLSSLSSIRFTLNACQYRISLADTHSTWWGPSRGLLGPRSISESISRNFMRDLCDFDASMSSSSSSKNLWSDSSTARRCWSVRSPLRLACIGQVIKLAGRRRHVITSTNLYRLWVQVRETSSPIAQIRTPWSPTTMITTITIRYDWIQAYRPTDWPW